ncbi:MAG: ferredoxin [Sphingomonas bacterium]|nr:ferredoxin [Sphingomonas bacterium]
MPYVITGGCIDVLDRACIKVCPVDCIYEGGRMMYIQADECIDCGACEPACPTNAIYYEDDLPDDMQVFAQANRTFFDALGSPGGARKIGKQEHDAGPAADRTE